MLPIETASVFVRHALAHGSSLRQHVRGRAGHQRLPEPDQIVIPVIFMGLHVFVAFVQTYVFFSAGDDLYSWRNRSRGRSGCGYHLIRHFRPSKCEPPTPQGGPEPPPRRNFIERKVHNAELRKMLVFDGAVPSGRPARCSRRAPAGRVSAPGELKFVGAHARHGHRLRACADSARARRFRARRKRGAESRRARWYSDSLLVLGLVFIESLAIFALSIVFER